MSRDLVSAMDVVARFYDLDLDGFDEDLGLYEGFAERVEGEVLEVGCGTGRVSEALARAGKKVIAVDASPGMLRRACQRSVQFETVAQDLRELDLGRKFALVIAPLGTLHHVPPNDRGAAFAAVRRHLSEGGLFVADLAVEADWSPGLQPLVCHWTRRDPGSGHLVSKFVAIESDPSSLSQEVTYFFDEMDSEDRLRRSVATFDLCYFTEHELTLLLSSHGMAVEAIYGDYDLTPLEARSERMIIVARAS